MNRRSTRLVERNQTKDTTQDKSKTDPGKADVKKAAQVTKEKQKVTKKIQKQKATKTVSRGDNDSDNEEAQVKDKMNEEITTQITCSYEKAALDDSQGDLRVLKFGTREYRFEIEDQVTKNRKGLIDLVNEFKDLIAFQDKKQLQKDDKILKIVDHYQFTALEYYFCKNQETIEAEKKKWKVQEDKCTICQFELYEEIENFTKQQLLEQLENESETDCLGLQNCQNHYFHRECLQYCIQEKHIKCPVCYQIYGEMTGDQPDGTMNYYIDKNMQCSTYNCGTIVISYSFPSGKRRGVSYSGTHRRAYLPNNAEGQEVLQLLQEGFKRKLLFTIGRSVTTGQDNTTVWNGVHHKTNLSGGSSHFGYPDPTYFDRVKLELAMKGVFPKK